jgi:hypothetical protein
MLQFLILWQKLGAATQIALLLFSAKQMSGGPMTI